MISINPIILTSNITTTTSSFFAVFDYRYRQTSGAVSISKYPIEKVVFFFVIISQLNLSAFTFHSYFIEIFAFAKGLTIY